MGHMEYYEFVDFREGECGVSYCRASLAEITALAEKVGCTELITKKVRAFPQAPFAVLKERAERAFRELNEEIPW